MAMLSRQARLAGWRGCDRQAGRPGSTAPTGGGGGGGSSGDIWQSLQGQLARIARARYPDLPLTRRLGASKHGAGHESKASAAHFCSRGRHLLSVAVLRAESSRPEQEQKKQFGRPKGGMGPAAAAPAGPDRGQAAFAHS